MNRIDLTARLRIIDIMLNGLVYDDNVCYDSALYGFLKTASLSVTNALLHTKEFVEHD